MRLMMSLWHRRRLLLFLAAVVLTLWGWVEWGRPPQPLLVWTVQDVHASSRQLLADGQTLVMLSGKYTRNIRGGHFARPMGPLRGWDVITGQETWRTGIPDLVVFPVRQAFPDLSLTTSPEGRWIAVEDLFGTLWLFDSVGQLRHTLTTTADLGFRDNFRFAADGRTLAYEQADGKAIILWDLIEGKQTAVLPGACRRFEFSPDSRTLAAGSVGSSTLGLWDVITGQKRFTLEGHSFPVRTICFTGDSRRLATGLKMGRYGQPPPSSTEVILWDAVTGKRLAKLPIDEPTGNNLHTLAFANEGRLLLATNYVKQNKMWDLSTLSSQGEQGESCKQLTEKQIPGEPHSGYRPLPIFSPDGKWLVLGDDAEGVVQLRDTTTLTEQRRFRIPDVKHYWFSPDNRTLVTRSERNKHVYSSGWRGLWDRMRGQPSRVERVEETSAVDIASGRTLLTVPGWYVNLTSDRRYLVTGMYASSWQTTTVTFRRWAVPDGWPLSWWLLGGAGLLWLAGLMSLWFRRKVV